MPSRPPPPLLLLIAMLMMPRFADAVSFAEFTPLISLFITPCRHFAIRRSTPSALHC
jgi:hypothetical protein